MIVVVADPSIVDCFLPAFLHYFCVRVPCTSAALVIVDDNVDKPSDLEGGGNSEWPVAVCEE